MPYIDIETAIQKILLEELRDPNGAAIPAADFSVDLPNVLGANQEQWITISEAAGTADYFQQDPAVDIDVFAKSTSRAKFLSAAILDIMVGYAGVVVVGGRKFMPDTITVLQKPQSLPWDVPDTRRRGATYLISARS